MTQDVNAKLFSPDTKRAGDLIKSQDWNTAMGEIVRLGAVKINRTGEETIGGPLTVVAGLTVQGNLGVPNGSLGLGIASPAKKLHVEAGELRVRASHNTAATDIAAFYSQNLTLGIGIGSSIIAAVGSSANQDITLSPKGTGALAVTGNFKLGKGATVNELSADGTLVGNLDTALPTQKAVKTYVDALRTYTDSTVRTSVDASAASVRGYVDSKAAGSNTQDFTAKSFTAPGALVLGATAGLKKVHIENGELRLRASHDGPAADLGAFYSQNQTLGIGIGSSTIAAIGSNTNQDITLVPKGTGAFIVNSNVGFGVGTTAPAARLQVKGGAIMPEVGNSETAGIMFPKDPGGGGGDAAWLRYYRRGDSGEATTLELGISNDAADHLALMTSGGVGIGTNEPTQKLEVMGNIKLSGLIIQQDWQTVTLQNNWVQYNTEYNAPGYYKDSMGNVCLKGLVKSGTISFEDSGVIFTLPTGYRPSARQLLPVQSNDTIGRVDITTDGKVRATRGNNTWFCLDGVSFRV